MECVNKVTRDPGLNSIIVTMDYRDRKSLIAHFEIPADAFDIITRERTNRSASRLTHSYRHLDPGAVQSDATMAEMYS